MAKEFFLQVNYKNPACGKAFTVPIAAESSEEARYPSFEEAEKELLARVQEEQKILSERNYKSPLEQQGYPDPIGSIVRSRAVQRLLPCSECGQARFYSAFDMFIQGPTDRKGWISAL